MKQSEKKRNYIKESYKSRESWLGSRGIGSSSAAAIVNASNWISIVDLYDNIIGTRKEEHKDNNRMKEGRLAEPLIRKFFIIEHPEFKVKEPPKKGSWLFRRKDYPLITCTPDGLFTEIETNKYYGLEIKDVEIRNKNYAEMWESGTIPNQYFTQCLHYMITINDLDGVCLLARLKYFRYDPAFDKFMLDHVEEKSFWITRENNLKNLEYLESKEIDFIENNIKKRIRPSLKFEF